MDAEINRWNKARSLLFKRSQSHLERKPIAKFRYALWPLNTEYYSPVHAVFLQNLPNLKSLELQPEWIIRDGLLPLVWFFLRNPRPSGLKAKLFVHSDLLFVVPSSWSKNIGAYRLVSNPTYLVSQSKRKNIRFTVTYTLYDILSSEEIETSLTRALVDVKPQGSVSDRHEVLLPFFYESLSPADLRRSLETYDQVSRLLNQKVGIVEWREVENRDSFQDVRVVDLGSKVYCADSYVSHLMLGRGATIQSSPLGAGTGPQAVDRYLALSSFHGFMLNETKPRPTFANRVFWDDFERVLRCAPEEKQNQFISPWKFQWPTWLGEWLMVELNKIRKL